MTFSKTAQQLSIQFLVRFILAIVVFGLGIALMWQIFFSSVDTQKISQDNFDQKIAALNCKPSEIICISGTDFEISSGEDVLIETKLSNLFSEDVTFDVFLEIRDSNNDEVPTGSDEDIQLLPKQYTDEVVEVRAEKELPFLIKTEKTLSDGPYVARFTFKQTDCGPNCLDEEYKRVQFTVS